MPIFAVVGKEGPYDNLERALNEQFPNEHIAVKPGVWLVSGKGIAKDISDRLGISDGKTAQGIVLTVNGYWGYASNAIWEWLALKQKVVA
jgi:hypothetical protein